jgi:sulfide:quinone oxidoreductase
LIPFRRPARERTPSSSRSAPGTTVAAGIVTRLHGTAPPEKYLGRGSYYIEFDGGLVGKVDADLLSGPAPTALLYGPSTEFSREKAGFDRSRRRRWFTG